MTSRIARALENDAKGMGSVCELLEEYANERAREQMKECAGKLFAKGFSLAEVKEIIGEATLSDEELNGLKKEACATGV